MKIMSLFLTPILLQAICTADYWIDLPPVDSVKLAIQRNSTCSRNFPGELLEHIVWVDPYLQGTRVYEHHHGCREHNTGASIENTARQK